jgi:hypothetical protein
VVDDYVKNRVWSTRDQLELMASEKIAI